MKKLVFIMVCLVAFAIGGFAQSDFGGEKGISSIGVIGGHAIRSKAPTIGVDYRYNILDKVRLAPSVMYVFENDYANTFYANADVHYLARITDEATLYPLVGIGLSYWKWDSVLEDLEDFLGLSEDKLRIGLNLGFGGEIRLTKDIIVGAEFRYNLTSERAYDQAMILARAAYYF
jgi:hypothetical protein